MIKLDDIKEFFNVINSDTEVNNREYSESTMMEKIKDGKAITGLRLDEEFKKVNDEDHIRLLHVVENLSEFKIGDGVILQMEKGGEKICDCSINDFRENGDIEISINPYNYSSSIDLYKKIDLALIKQNISMRDFYSSFCFSTEFLRDGYFENHVINVVPQPEFDGDLLDFQSQIKDAHYKNFNVILNKTQLEAASKSFLTKSYYLIQGPPGTGKSYLLAYIILANMFSKQKIVVVAPTHTAVNNLLLKVAELFIKCCNNKDTAKYYIENFILKCGQSYNAKNLHIAFDNESVKITNIQNLNTTYFNSWSYVDCDGNTVERQYGYVIGMTPYSLQSRRARGLEFDKLIIDEAGQMTIPIALMALVKCNNFILAGDHRQLPPIVSENIKNAELRHSIFEHLIRDYNCTMLDVSFRMNDVICTFVSDLFYEGKLKSFNRHKRLLTSLTEVVYAAENPIVFIDCKDNGKQFSNVESQTAIKIAIKYINSGISPEDIAILAPFRAQCALMRKMLMPYFTKEQRDRLVIDTVDRMQGQEREIIIYSFTSGDVEYMMQMETFLYNTNKLNVAFSRAKNKLILLGNIKAIKTINNELLCQIINYKSILIR